MSATGKKVLRHPAKEEIDEKLLAGESVEAVASWLKQKYAKRKSFQVNKMTLQAYRKNYLNVQGEVLADIQEERRERQARERTEKRIALRKESPEYQLAKANAAQEIEHTVANFRDRLEDMLVRTEERLEIMEAQKISHLNEKVIVEQLRLQKDLVKEFFDMEKQMRSEAEVNINVDVHKMMQEMKVLKVALREAINEVCPELLSVFMTTLSEKLKKARIHMDEEFEDIPAGGVTINVKH